MCARRTRVWAFGPPSPTAVVAESRRIDCRLPPAVSSRSHIRRCAGLRVRWGGRQQRIIARGSQPVEAYTPTAMAETPPKRKAKPKRAEQSVLGTLPASRPERIGRPRREGGEREARAGNRQRHGGEAARREREARRDGHARRCDGEARRRISAACGHAAHVPASDRGAPRLASPARRPRQRRAAAQAARRPHGHRAGHDHDPRRRRAGADRLHGRRSDAQADDRPDSATVASR